jgi:Flp pilus assembly protein TadD
MRGLIILTLTFSTGLSACVGTTGQDPLDPIRNGVDAPQGTVVLRDAVDGLLVGDRLMEAGEYELALRAYYRAGAEDGLTADVLTSIGSANLQLGRIGQAEQQFRSALDVDETFIPAWNNLGVVLMEQGEYGEARRVFQQAFALDSGHSDAIRDNLRLAIARMENAVYAGDNNENGPELIRRGGGVYELHSDP